MFLLHIAAEPFLLSIFITLSDDKTKSQQRIIWGIERDNMDSTGIGGSRSKVLRNLHIVRHQVPHLLRYVKEIV